MSIEANKTALRRAVASFELFVRAAQRRRGWGEAALRVAEAAYRELGVRALHLEVEREKSPAQTLYRKCGFVDHRRHLMTKRLDTP